MTNQKELFQLPVDIHYLNCGYMSPLLRSVEEAGMIGMQRKRNPSAVFSDDFFNQSETLRKLFGQLINCPAEQTAIIPSTSYALQAAMNNIGAHKGTHAITVADEFPSDYYTIRRWCDENKKELKIIKGDKKDYSKGRAWNQKILEAITPETSVVIMSSIHWTDGTKFNLKEIGKRCKEVDAFFIIDGTQSVGALPMEVNEFNIDVLVCAAYKWMLGPYSMGMAYFSDFFNNGKPLEESWLNRINSNNFSALTAYKDEYRPAAERYNVGEHSNFILTPMLIRSIEQIMSWKVESIQEYCGQIIQPLIKFLQENNFTVEEDKFRANHLFGFLLPTGFHSGHLLEELQKRKIFVSVRGDAIRVSPHLYNDENDVSALIEALATLTR